MALLADAWPSIVHGRIMLVGGVAFVGLGHLMARNEPVLRDFLRGTIAAREP